MKTVQISPEQARRLVIGQQLFTADRIKSGKAGTELVINNLAYTQIDTIHVINRAHHHVVWSRQPDYRPEYLNNLLSVDREIFEFWTHAAGDIEYVTD